MKINTDENKINEILTRGVHDAFTSDEIKQKLMSGKQLHLKLGIDVTGPNIHLGHAVVQRKIRDFQELGHKLTLIIGDFTTLVGDHSDKVEMREETNPEQIKEFEKTYVEQFFKTVIKEQTEIRHNSEWLKPLDFNDILGLTRQFTISQMLDRETFMLRYKQNKPIGLDEFLYPLMQGYDSVALKCDIEFGGTDQTFNLLAGRKIMPSFGLPAQSAMVMKLLTGSDGKPMGKSLQNFIPILDDPINMYGKVMSIIDDIIFEYFELCTRVPLQEIQQMKQQVQNGENPMHFKKILAHNIVTFYHNENLANNAAKVFEQTVQNKDIADESKTAVSVTGKMTLLQFLKDTLQTETSSSEIKRTIQQGGVEVNGDKVVDINTEIEFNKGDLIKFGKRTFLEIN